MKNVVINSVSDCPAMVHNIVVLQGNVKNIIHFLISFPIPYKCYWKDEFLRTSFSFLILSFCSSVFSCGVFVCTTIAGKMTSLGPLRQSARKYLLWCANEHIEFRIPVSIFFFFCSVSGMNYWHKRWKK